MTTPFGERGKDKGFERSPVSDLHYKCVNIIELAGFHDMFLAVNERRTIEWDYEGKECRVEATLPYFNEHKPSYTVYRANYTVFYGDRNYCIFENDDKSYTLYGDHSSASNMLRLDGKLKDARAEELLGVVDSFDFEKGMTIKAMHEALIAGEPETAADSSKVIDITKTRQTFDGIVALIQPPQYERRQKTKKGIIKATRAWFGLDNE